MATASDVLACWRCGKIPTVDPNGGYPTVACDDCYDGAPDSSSRNDLGSGLNRAEAVEAWNEKVREATACEECGAEDDGTRKIQIGASLFWMCPGCAKKIAAAEL